MLALAGLATALGTAYQLREIRAADQTRFEETIERTVLAIRVRIDTYISGLYAARAFFDSGETSRVEFRSFVDRLQITERYPGIQGIGFAQRITAAEVPSFEQKLHAEGFPAFKIWPPTDAPERSAILFLEPFDARNQRAFGFDMLSEATRREAMQRARATGAPAMSGKVFLVQETVADVQPGFLLYLPTHGARDGWVYSPFRSYDLVRGIFPPNERRTVDFQIYAGALPVPDQLLVDAEGGMPLHDSRTLRQLRHLTLAGQPWTLTFVTQPEFFASSPRTQVWAVALLGSLASLLLFGIARIQARARSVAEERQARTSFLAEAGRLLGESLDYSGTLDRVAQLSVQTLADWCVVHLVEDNEIRDVAIVHRDPEMRRFGVELSRRFPRDPNARTGVPQVLRTGRPELMSIVPAALLEQAAMPAEYKEGLRRAQIRSFMCVPLIARGITIGAITFIAAEPGRFGHAELSLAEDLAMLAATAVDNARLYADAQKAVRIRDEFLSIASHELKTPLTSMVLKLDGLRRVEALQRDDRGMRGVEVLQRQVRRLTRLVDSLLDVSRIAAGRLKLDLEEVDLAAVATEVAGGLKDELVTTGSTLKVIAPPAPVIGRWDRMRVEQVVMNLLSNAIKYGAGQPVELVVEDAGERGRLVVRDRGIGISPEDLVRVFGRFERAVPSANYGGLGLGLYISKQIVDALGGELRGEATAGGGTTFTMVLPKAPRPATSPATDPRAPH